MRSVRPATFRLLGLLIVAMSALPPGCATSEKSVYVGHLTGVVKRGPARNEQLASAFGLDGPDTTALAAVDMVAAPD
jgi:hypothetical protein